MKVRIYNVVKTGEPERAKRLNKYENTLQIEKHIEVLAEQRCFAIKDILLKEILFTEFPGRVFFDTILKFIDKI